MDRRPEVCGSEILKTISILDAIYWVNQSWNEVQPSTIQKCFNKVGFDTCEVESTCTEEDVPLAIFKLSKDYSGAILRNWNA